MVLRGIDSNVYLNRESMKYIKCNTDEINYQCSTDNTVEQKQKKKWKKERMSENSKSKTKKQKPKIQIKVFQTSSCCRRIYKECWSSTSRTEGSEDKE